MKSTVIVVGAGPAGLSASEVLAEAGWSVTVVEALASPGRKLLRAGVGGLNLTHSQPFEAFLSAYGPHAAILKPFLSRFGPIELRTWAQGLGITLFTGTSGRVFPQGLSAAPLLEAWLVRLGRQGVIIKTGTRWVGWKADHQWEFETADSRFVLEADALVLALGGPSWPTLGTGGSWVPLLEKKGVNLVPWKPANVGFTVDWTPFFRDKFAGEPLKDIVLQWDDGSGTLRQRQGELVVTPWGLEGGLIYAATAPLRDGLQTGPVTVQLDLIPGRDRERVEAELARPRERRSLATHLKKTLGLSGVKIGLLREMLRPGSPDDPKTVAGLLKALPLKLTGTRPLTEAISAAGGVRWDELTPELELRRVPGVWCAGEMIDWEAPTGGYLLTACFSLGRGVGRAVVDSRR